MESIDLMTVLCGPAESADSGWSLTETLVCFNFEGEQVAAKLTANAVTNGGHVVLLCAVSMKTEFCRA